jgi:hypothetical protein
VLAAARRILFNNVHFDVGYFDAGYGLHFGDAGHAANSKLYEEIK